MNGYTMLDQKRVGEVGEAVTMVLFTFLGTNNLRAFCDVRHEKDFREMDVDFIIMADGRVLYVEVKTDTYVNTGNMFIEIWSSKEAQTPGCFLKTKARYLFYFFVNGLTFVIEVKPFMKWIERNKYRFRTKTVPNSSGYHSEGYLVPLEEVSKLPCVTQIEPLKILGEAGIYIPPKVITTEEWVAKSKTWLHPVSADNLNLSTGFHLPYTARVYSAADASRIKCDASRLSRFLKISGEKQVG